MNNIAANLATKYGTIKAASMYPDMPQFMLDTARAMRYDMPDVGAYETQSRLYARLSWIYSAVKATAERCALEKLNVKRRQGEELVDIPNHELEVLLDKPNPKHSRYELLRDTFCYGAINGNAYWWLNRPAAGGGSSEKVLPKEIWPLASWRVLPIPDDKLFIKGYQYSPGNGQPDMLIPPWQIVHFTGFNPLNEFVGLSDIEPIGQTASTDIANQEWSYKFFKGNARLPGILAFKDTISNPIEWERIKDEVSQSARMRNIMMLRGVHDKVEWLQAAATQEEMQLIAQRQFTKEEIYSIIAPGLASMLAINATEANSKAGLQTWLSMAIYTRLVAMAQKITNFPLPLYGDNLVAEFDDPRQVDRALELQEQDAYGKVHTINEIRKEYYQDKALPEDDERGEMLPAQIGIETAMPGSEERTPPQLKPFTGQAPEPAEEEPPELEEEDEEAPAEMKANLKTWRRKALNALKASGNAAVTFESAAISPELHAEIWGRLSACKSTSDVREVFDEAMTREKQQAADLLAELKRANDLLEGMKKASEE